MQFIFWSFRESISVKIKFYKSGLRSKNRAMSVLFHILVSFQQIIFIGAVTADSPCWTFLGIAANVYRNASATICEYLSLSRCTTFLIFMWKKAFRKKKIHRYDKLWSCNLIGEFAKFYFYKSNTSQHKAVKSCCKACLPLWTPYRVCSHRCPSKTK